MKGSQADAVAERSIRLSSQRNPRRKSPLVDDAAHPSLFTDSQE
jgi:hypothetical protein